MRFLFICDQYPPFDRGGYAQLCFDLAHALRNRRNEVTVLCAEQDSSADEVEPVVRGLQAPVQYADRTPAPVQQMLLAGSRKRRSIDMLRKVVREVKPEAAVFWPTPSVDLSLMHELDRYSHLRVGYYIAGYSPTQPSLLTDYWSAPGRSRMIKVVKSILRPLMSRYHNETKLPALKNVMCVSEFERQRVIKEGILPQAVVVIHNGINCDTFGFLGLPSTRRAAGQPLKILYAGRLTQEKGAHILLEAMNALCLHDHPVNATATLLGAGPVEYSLQLDATIAGYGLSDRVDRQPWIERDRMPAFMAQYDVLVLPTIRAEALSRVVQEAMALGLVVVATPTGGTPEIVLDNETGLLYPSSSPDVLATSLERLYNDLALCDHLAQNAHDLVRSQFTIQHMAEQVEMYLTTKIDDSSPCN